ncbi:MAG: hypothetical protein MK111_07870, partial [Crocosphaera sp.]|uniref:hypothetical protein n=1 Tax=Crocosphaera sp. TaxID=2729996 RepID=UPI00258AF794
ISISPKNYHFSSLDWAFKLICEKSGKPPNPVVNDGVLRGELKGGSRSSHESLLIAIDDPLVVKK